MAATDFDRDTMLWLDHHQARLDEYVASQRVESPEVLRGHLEHWVANGYLHLEGAIAPELVDAYLADVEQLVERREVPTHVLVHEIGIRSAHEFTSEQLDAPHMRILDFHNTSVAGKQIALHQSIVGFLKHVFRDTVVAMQSLTFLRGSQQGYHQDFPYVVSGIPSHLAAAWIALEDVDPASGPLAYYPGSHKIAKFDWGNGIIHTPESTKNEHDFEAHLKAECKSLGLDPIIVLAKKGDVFLWHGALVHAGTPVDDPELTRRSFVVHYTSRRAYPRDRRDLNNPPVAYGLNGGVAYRDARWPESENVLNSGGLPVPPIVD